MGQRSSHRTTSSNNYPTYTTASASSTTYYDSYNQTRKDWDIYAYCKKGELVNVKSLLKPSQLETPDTHGNTLLYYACLCGHVELVTFLSELGARDDKYKRCYWNSLSLTIRKILKHYNQYTFEEGKSKEFEASSVRACLKRMVSRVVNETERNPNSDVEIRIKCSDEETSKSYYCNLWILLARWPMLIYNQLCLLNAKGVSNVKFFNQQVDRVCAEEELQIMEQKIPQTLEELTIQFREGGLSVIDIGTVDITRSLFECILIFVYSGKVVSDPTNIFQPKGVNYGERIFGSDKFLSACESFGLYEVHDIVKGHSKIGSKLKKQFLSDIGCSFFLESYQPKGKIEQLRKWTCDFKLKVEQFVEGIQVENASTDSILCHKLFIIERSSFFHTIISGNFEESEKIREFESHHELPLLELQCSNIEILQELCRYFYSEHLNLNEHNVLEIFSYSHTLGLRKSILTLCEKFIGEMNIDSQDLIPFCKVCMPIFSEKMKTNYEKILLKHLYDPNGEVKGDKDKVREILIDLDYDNESIERFMQKMENE